MWRDNLNNLSVDLFWKHGLYTEQISLPYNAIGFTKELKMCLTADGFNALSNTPCLIRNNVLLAFMI